MKIRLRKLDDDEGRSAKYEVCLQEGESGWTCSTVGHSRLTRVLLRKGRIEDNRDLYMLDREAVMARRRYGLGGYVEYTLGHGMELLDGYP